MTFTWHSPKWLHRALAPLVEYEREKMLVARALKMLVKHPCLTLVGAARLVEEQPDRYETGRLSGMAAE